MTEVNAPKILIVEDDIHAHELYRNAFDSVGFDVTICSDADGFFAEHVDELKPDIISMDLMIGKGGRPAERDGFEAIRLLKADLRTADIPIIVLSSFFQEEHVKHAKELGAVDYISTSGYEIQKIPMKFLEYLKNPAHYRPLHPVFYA